MRRLGRLYRPLEVTRARYSGPLGTCTAVTVAVVIGCPWLLGTVPVSAAVVTPCAAATDDVKSRKTGARDQRNPMRLMCSLRGHGFFAEGLIARDATVSSYPVKVWASVCLAGYAGTYTSPHRVHMYDLCQ